MRVYLTRPLLRIVEGIDHTLNIRGRLSQSINSEIETQLGDFPKNIARQFNFDTTEREMVDFASTPIVYAPDDFTFFLDVESLGRLAREVLIEMIPLDASTWASRGVSIVELWVGGRDGLLPENERVVLRKKINEILTKPVRRRVFVLDEASFRSHARLIGSRDAIRGADGIVHMEPSPRCDYYVTDRQEAFEVALRSGAKEVIDTLTLSVMLGGHS